MPYEKITVSGYVKEKQPPKFDKPMYELYIDDYALSNLKGLKKGDTLCFMPKKDEWLDEKKPDVTYTAVINRHVADGTAAPAQPVDNPVF